MVAAYLFLAFSSCDSDLVVGRGTANAIETAIEIDDDFSLGFGFDWASDSCGYSLFVEILDFCFDFGMMDGFVYYDMNAGSCYGGVGFSIVGCFVNHLDLIWLVVLV